MNFRSPTAAGKSTAFLALLAFNAAAATLYVDINSTNPVSPYSDWSMAATNIQEAVDAAGTGDLVLVNDGVYQTGGRVVYGALINRVAVTNAVTVQSVNGPAVTVIQGYRVPGTTNGDAAIRCVYLTTGAALSGFTLTNGATRATGDIYNEQCGGAVWCNTNGTALVSNCVLAGCSAAQSGGAAFGVALGVCMLWGNVAPKGGGAYLSTLNDCTLSNNLATAGSGSGGGGASFCTLSNCTLVNNQATYGGAVNSATVIACRLVGNRARNNGGGAYGGTLSNSTLTANSISSFGFGGGASCATLFSCQVTSNSAQAGGGVYSCNLTDCSIASNSSSAGGGGAQTGNLTNCTLAGNSSQYGGAAADSTLVSCSLTGNTATDRGGGAYNSTLRNCALNGNVATGSSGAGGGAYAGMLYNCTVVGNAATGASSSSGGIWAAQIYNSVIYYNSAPANADCSASTKLYYCCTPRFVGGDEGNITNEPQLASISRLSSSSPCGVAGNSSYASGTDIDGELWANPPSIGCDQYTPGAVTGAITAAIQIDYTNLFPGMPANLVARIGGKVSASRWEFDDGTIVSNRPFVSRSWSAFGSYPVVLRAYNESYPAGVTATLTVQVGATSIHYVALSSTAPQAPYASWGTAATNIQDAVDAAGVGDEVVVTNGVYQTGARVVYGALSNRVAVTKAITLRSVNGPSMTTIKGYQVPITTNGNSALRCVYLTNGAVLAGFTLANGATRGTGDPAKEEAGGAVWCEANAVVSNCVLVGNSASSYGGAVYQGKLVNCTLIANRAQSSGGGSYACNLSNCVLAANVAAGGNANGGGAYNCTLSFCLLSNNVSSIASGGGASHSSLNNCVLTGNSAYQAGGGAESCGLNNCALTGNSAANSGGGASGGSMTNCTIIGNWGYRGGGTENGILRNCLVYYNQAAADANCWGGTIDYCCTTPLPPGGAGNANAEPELAGGWHLSANSPCIGRGNASYGTGVDLDGELWRNPPAIGCDEYWGGTSTEELSVAIAASYTNVAAGFTVDLQALIGGRADVSWWDFGDGIIQTNKPFARHGWSAPGDYEVELRACSAMYPAGLAAMVTIHVLAQPVLYVSMVTNSPAPPYDSWAKAAPTIQDAIDAAPIPGSLLWVSNGFYGAGARVAAGMSNRVAITTPLIVRSVNGPAVTIIQGYQVPGTTNGNAAVRCAYLTNGAVLDGFTLSGGATKTSFHGGGVWCESATAVLTNCVLTGNSAGYQGGGAYMGTLNNCVLTGNSALRRGGGMFSATLNNCTVIGNSSADTGGGAYDGRLNNCTLAGNSAVSSGGGASSGTLSNCIVYYNQAPFGKNCSGGSLSYCCTTPLPVGGSGNFDADPQLASASHLSARSPCIGRGSMGSAGGTDIDGEAWHNPPSIGCDEFWSSTTGALSAAIAVSYTTVAAGYGLDLQASIGGPANASRWDFGDGTVVSNAPFARHAWLSAGDYVVELRAYNTTFPVGVVATVNVHVLPQPVFYVSVVSAQPVWPYNSWATAARTIQDAVDAAALPGSLVWVSQGMYVSGAQAVYGMSNRVAVTKPVVVRSVSGPALTRILGYWVPGSTNGDAAVRCAYLTNGAVLDGFSLTGGATQYTGDSRGNQSGGGVWCESPSAVLTNCVITGCAAANQGGGGYGGTLINCVVAANYAGFGGGVANSTATNCTLTGNWARTRGGGAYSSTLINSIVYYNQAPEGSNYLSSALGWCCAVPPAEGQGNLTNAPQFVDTNDWGNLRLQTNSPCINAGLASSAPASDLDGQPRMCSRAVAIGAYEFQEATSIISYAWLQQYGLPTDGSADMADTDGDGMNNWQEWRAGTDPTNALSFLQMFAPTNDPSGVIVTWQSSTNRVYYLERSVDLSAQPAFLPLQSDIMGLDGTTSYMDTNAVGAGPFFYRVGAQ
jgi:hypothetical protein